MNQTLKKQILEFFEKERKYCQSCGNMRTEITENNVPKEVKDLNSIMEEGSTLLFCKHCEEYSVISPIESSF
jgi:hypothetical protein